jgi:hypothetical protein
MTAIKNIWVTIQDTLAAMMILAIILLILGLVMLIPVAIIMIDQASAANIPRIAKRHSPVVYPLSPIREAKPVFIPPPTLSPAIKVESK